MLLLFLKPFFALFGVIDPVGNTPIFLTLTDGIDERRRRDLAWRGVLRAGAILIVFLALGSAALEAFHVSFESFRIAGGLLLLTSAADMVFDRRAQREQKTADEAISVDHVKNIAAFPLAIPLMAGPGAITAMILLAGRAEGRLEYYGALFAVAALVMLACYLCYLLAERIAKVMGVTGRAVMTRLLGIVLAALAVQFVIDGVQVLLRT